MSDFEKLINASDLIEWIIETDPDWCVGSVRCIIDHIDKMPSTQSDLSEYSDKLWKAAYERGKAEALAEIVRCKDCNHWSRESICDGFCSEDCMRHDEDFYCGYAERRTDG